MLSAGALIAPEIIVEKTAIIHKEKQEMRAKIENMKKKGQGLVEYALILVLIAIVVIVILTFLGSQVNSTFSEIGSGLR
jgi:pilus assembly protein Flp/PilA